MNGRRTAIAGGLILGSRGEQAAGAIDQVEDDRSDSAASADRGDLFVQPMPAGRSGGGEQVDDRQDGVRAGRWFVGSRNGVQDACGGDCGLESGGIAGGLATILRRRRRSDR